LLGNVLLNAIEMSISARRDVVRGCDVKSGFACGNAFGAGSLFAEYVVSESALRSSVLGSSSDVAITGRGTLGKVDWNTTKDVPLRGMFRGRTNTCYVVSVAQVLLRIPAVLDWAICHNAGGCPAEGSACVLC
jgi:hypothetical protein